MGTAEALERDPHTIGRWAAAFGEGGPATLMFEQSGGSPRLERGTTGGFEGDGPRIARGSQHRPRQLELEGGPSVYLGYNEYADEIEEYSDVEVDPDEEIAEP